MKRDALQESLVIIPAIDEAKVVAPDQEGEIVFGMKQAQGSYASYRIVRKR